MKSLISSFGRAKGFLFLALMSLMSTVAHADLTADITTSLNDTGPKLVTVGTALGVVMLGAFGILVGIMVWRKVKNGTSSI